MKKYIYIITFQSGKKYIGNTSNVKNRMYGHLNFTKKNKNLPIYKEMIRSNYKFEFEILCWCKSQKKSYELEHKYIKKFNTIYPFGLNSTYGNKLTKSHVEKIRLANLGKVRTQEMKKKYSLSKIGIPKSESHKRKISKTLSGRPNLALSKRVKCSNGKTYDSMSAAARELGLSVGNIHSAVCGKYKTCGGFEWLKS